MTKKKDLPECPIENQFVTLMIYYLCAFVLVSISAFIIAAFGWIQYFTAVVAAAFMAWLGIPYLLFAVIYSCEFGGEKR